MKIVKESLTRAYVKNPCAMLFVDGSGNNFNYLIIFWLNTFWTVVFRRVN